MIITCPSCKKKFNVDESLIPSNGRMLECGFCTHNWFFKKNEKIINEIHSDINLSSETSLNDTTIESSPSVNISSETQIPKETESIISQAEKNISKNINDIILKDKVLDETKSNSITNFFSYLIVFVISFIAVVIVIDTFKTPLNNIFPGLENLLFSLFETLKDIKLFIIDLT